MKFYSKLLGLFLLVLFSTNSQANNFYICDSGDDNNNGMSEAAPFKTFDKAIDTFNGMSAGSNVLFCRGGIFNITTDKRLYNKSCSASVPCTISDYGDKSKAKPLFNTAGDLTAFNFQESGNADPDGGYTLKNLTIIAQNSNGKGVFLYNDVDDVLLENLHIEGFRIAIHSSGSNTLNPGTNGINDRLVVRNNTIINNRSIGFQGGCQDCLIEGNYFENNGFGQKILDHNIYLGWTKFPAKNITIRNNTLYKSTMIDGKCQGVSLVVHGLFNDLTIENNIVKEDVGKVSGYCWGISVDPGYSKVDEAFYNVKIFNNKLINVGNVAIGCASCEGAMIHNNEIIDEGEVLSMGIKVPVRTENTLKSNNISIKNNKIFLNNLNGYGISIGGAHKTVVTGNEINLPRDTKKECFEKSGENLMTDTTNNICNLHNGISIVEPVIDNNSNDQTESTIADNISNDDGIRNHEEVIVENQPIAETSVTNQPEIAEEMFNQDNIVEQNVKVNVPIDENTNFISEPTESTQLPTTDLNIIESNTNTETVIETTTTVSEVSSNEPEYPVNLNESSSDGATTRSNSKSQNAASGGAGKTKKTSTNSTTSNLASTSDDLVSNNIQSSSTFDTASSITTVETEQGDIDKESPKSNSDSSKYSVKVKDVIEASRNQNEITDVTQCRAYAAGKCLMK